MSAERQGDRFNLDERDRLPWLEPAGIEEEPERVAPLKLAGLVVLGLLLLGIVAGGGYWLQTRGSGGNVDEAAGIITAQSQTYKIPANASDAKEFDGEGDAAFEASEGGEGGSQIDASKVPEAPRADLMAKAPAAAPAPARPTVTAAVKSVPVAAAASSGPASGATEAGAPRIQIGAFGSKDLAESVWKKMSGRFDYLAELSHSVEPVESGGKTLYRLRAGVASAADAAALCGRLRVAGENCMVVR